MTAAAALRDGARVLLTFAVAVGGGGLFHYLGLPAAWLTGAMTATLLAMFARLPLIFPRPLRVLVLVVVGTTIGSALGPELLRGFLTWPGTLVALALSVGLAMTLGYRFLRRFGGFSRPTAFFAAFPGHLSMALGAAVEAGADVPRVAVTQSLRLVALVGLLPAVLAVTPPEASLALRTPTDWPALGLLFAAAATGAAVAAALRAPAPALTGSILGAGAATLAGLPAGRPPLPVEIAVLIMLGAMIGTRFQGLRAADVVAMLPVALGNVALVILIAAGVALPVALLFDLPIGQVMLSFAPGGADAMAVIALALGYDPGFVGFHHMARLMGMALALPLLGRRFLTLGAGNAE